MVGDPGVSPIGPSRKTLYPASPSLKWVPGTLVPHLLGQVCTTPGLRYYDSLRLPMAHLGGVRFSLSFPDTLYHASFFVSLSLKGSCERRTLPLHAGSLHLWSALLHLIVRKETIGSPKFPSHPCRYMPRSQTPVVS